MTATIFIPARPTVPVHDTRLLNPRDPKTDRGWDQRATEDLLGSFRSRISVGLGPEERTDMLGVCAIVTDPGAFPLVHVQGPGYTNVEKIVEMATQIRRQINPDLH